MKLTLLKLSYAIEIGAYLAYIGHYKRSNDFRVKCIALEELRHMIMIRDILQDHNTTPSKFFNSVFFVIGMIIKHLCRITPKRLLNLVAGVLEIFNVVNYNYLGRKFPDHYYEFTEMAECEYEHEVYFLAKS